MMKRQSSKLFLLLGVVMAVTIFALAVPGRNVMADDDSDTDKPLYIPFTVINQSQFDLTLSLYGPSSYEITVPPKSEADYWLDRGWYAFTMESCTLSEVGTFDFTSRRTLHVPICGGTAGIIDRSSQHIDASDYIRPATIKVRNRTRENVDVYIRTLEEHHFMKFDPMETQYLLIEDASQEFVYSYLACGVLHSGYTRLYVHVPFDITCNP